MIEHGNEAETAAKLDMWWRGLSDGQRAESLVPGSSPEWMERSLRSGHIDAASAALFLDAKRSGTA